MRAWPNAIDIDHSPLAVTDHAYDSLGRVLPRTEIAATAPGGATTTYAYDDASRLTQTLDPVTANAVTGVEHQPRATTVCNPDGSVASTTVDDAKGVDPARTTTFGYDSHGRVTTMTDAGGGFTTTEYDYYDDNLPASERLADYQDPAGPVRELSNSPTPPTPGTARSPRPLAATAATPVPSPATPVAARSSASTTTA